MGLVGKKGNRKSPQSKNSRRRALRRKYRETTIRLSPHTPEYLRKFLNGKKGSNFSYSKAGLGYDADKLIDKKMLTMKEKGELEKFEKIEHLNDLKTHLIDPEADPDRKIFEECVGYVPKPKVEKIKFMAPFERRYWHRLILYYGDDYLAMARDHKRNNYQHTKKTCEKKCKIFHDLYGYLLLPPEERGGMRPRTRKYRVVFENHKGNNEGQTENQVQ